MASKKKKKAAAPPKKKPAKKARAARATKKPSRSKTSAKAAASPNKKKAVAKKKAAKPAKKARAARATKKLSASPTRGAKKAARATTSATKKVAKVADVKKVAKVGPKPTTTIVQHVFIQATPEQVYDGLADPTIAASIIGGECTGAPIVGGDFTQWNQYIHGKHLELVRGERIVQEWTTTEWPKGVAPSRVEFQLTGTGGGTELTMTHSSVPSAQAEDIRQGWIDFYWTPMRAHFGG